MRAFLVKALSSALAALLVAGPAAAEVARLPERLDLGVSAPASPSLPNAPLPAALPALPAEAAVAAPFPALPTAATTPAAAPQPLAAADKDASAAPQAEKASPEQAQADAGRAFDGGGPPKRPRGAPTASVLRSIGLTTALAAATVPWHTMHPAWIAIGAIPVLAGLALGVSRISLRDPATDRPLVPAPKMSIGQTRRDIKNFFLRKKSSAAPRAIRKWRYIADLKGPLPMRLAGPGVWFATTGLRIATNATLALWVPFAPVHVLGRVVQIAGLGLAAFSAYFFRDPQRAMAFGPDDVASPADGRILSVRSEKPGEITVRIFLSALNVHVQRAPFEGRVTDMSYAKGKFVVASTPEAAEKNERNSTRIEGRDGRWAVVDQLTGFVARRIATWVEPGDGVAQGQRTGMIFFGSQVAIHLPASAKVLVKPGDKVVGGRSILARF